MGSTWTTFNYFYNFLYRTSFLIFLSCLQCSLFVEFAVAEATSDSALKFCTARYVHFAWNINEGCDSHLTKKENWKKFLGIIDKKCHILTAIPPRQCDQVPQSHQKALFFIFKFANSAISPQGNKRGTSGHLSVTKSLIDHVFHFRCTWPLVMHVALALRKVAVWP